jgi:hypothetical protein
MRNLWFSRVLGARAKGRFAVAAIVVASVVAPAYASANAAAPARLAGAAALSKSCSASYVHANLSWGEKCLRAGEFCKVGNREYARYSFVCPATGHLRRR